MRKIITSKQIPALAEYIKSKNKIVLAGGCFDILHPGHIDFLAKAKQLGDVLIVMLEPDEKIKKLKGEDRPVNSLEARAINLSKLSEVDFVLKLPNLKTDADYEALVKKIEPDIIALTAEDRVFNWEKKSKIRVIKVMKKVTGHSTTKIIQNSNK